MKFKKMVTKLKENWDYLSMQQKIQTFDLAWEGNQIPNNKYINKIKNKLPGPHYKIIYSLIEKVCVEQLKEDKQKLLKELKDFYSRPITPEQRKYYPGLKSELEDKINKPDIAWLNEIILPDLKQCEEIQRKRLMKRYGLLT